MHDETVHNVEWAQQKLTAQREGRVDIQVYLLLQGIVIAFISCGTRGRCCSWAQPPSLVGDARLGLNDMAQVCKNFFMLRCQLRIPRG